MNKPVLNALEQLLKFKGWTTVPELTKTSGVKAIKVLTALNDNHDLLVLLKKTGRITGFADVQSKQREKLIHEGKVYIPSQTGYNEYKTLDYFGNKDNALFKTLSCRVTVGFFGDSRTETVVLDTPENRAVLEQHGIRNINDVKLKTIRDMWKE